MKRWLVLCLASLLCLCSCAQEQRRAGVILGEYLAEQEGLPQGEIYYSGLSEGEAGHFSDRLAILMYGERAVRQTFPLIEEYAIFLCSFAEPCEIAVFRCYEKSDADRVAEMCLERVEQMRILLGGTDFRTRADRATVTVEGCLVTMLLLP